MRSLIIIASIGGIGYALYNYFNKQLKLALDWDFKIKDLKVNEFSGRGADLTLLVSVLNKSAFALTVKNYDIDVIYEGVKIGNAVNKNPFVIQAESWFDVPTKAFIEFSGAKGILDDLAITLLKNEQLLFDVKGKMNVVFGNIPKEVIFNVKDIVVSQAIGTQLGIDKPILKLNDFLGKLGVKL